MTRYLITKGGTYLLTYDTALLESKLQLHLLIFPQTAISCPHSGGGGGRGVTTTELSARGAYAVW